MTFEQFEALGAPCVYIFWQDGVALYVGKSKHGLSRPLSRQHKIRGSQAFTPTDIDILWCKTYQEADDLEKEQIVLLEPKLNSPRLLEQLQFNKRKYGKF